MRTTLPAAFVLAASATAHAAVFTVNSAADAPDAMPGDGVCDAAPAGGPCTLRAAIEESNATAGADAIRFEIGAGVQTIAPATALPSITDPVDIDGTTQPGFAATPIVEIRGSSTAVDGLTIAAGSSTVRGLVISGFGQGIRLVGQGGNLIAGNFIGTDVTGTVARRNNSDGIAVYTGGNTIGGTAAGDRNVIAGNANGVCLCSSAAAGNVVLGNYIGTDVTGTAALGNGSIFYEVPWAGVAVYRAANNTIGGTAPGARNVISGNIGVGVLLLAAGSNVVEGNYIGVDAGGTARLGNRLEGVAIASGSANTIGGTAAGSRNVVSGNGSDGISIYVDGRENASPNDNRIQGNAIGTNAAVDALVGNGLSGVGVRSGGGTLPALRNQITGNVIAGNAYTGVFIAGTGATGNPTAFNTIAYNQEHGVQINGSAIRNAIVANSIFGNGGLGIELGNSGVTPNDPGDLDTGANRQQNFPVIASAVTSGGTTTIGGTLQSTPSRPIRIELFASTDCDPSGHGEGARLIAVADGTTDATGAASFSVTTTVPVPAGSAVTATATNDFGDSSEFSPCVVVS